MVKMMPNKSKLEAKPIHLYILLLLVIIIAEIAKIDVTIAPSALSHQFYESISSIPPESTVLFSIEYDFSSNIELDPMLEASVKQCMARNIKMIFISLTPEGPGIIHKVVEKNIKNASSEKKGLVYGKDYVNLGYITGGIVAVEAFLADFKATFPKDFYGHETYDMEILNKNKDVVNINSIIDFSSGFIDSIYIPVVYKEFVKSRDFKTKVLAGTTASIVANVYPFVQSKQIDAFLAGLKGAADYELLLKLPEKEQKAVKTMRVQVTIHILLIALIVLTNIIYFLGKRKK